MSRAKRNSKTLEEAQRLLEALQTISETLDFGNGASVQAFLNLIAETQTVLAQYNKLLTQADEAMRDVEDAEKALKKMMKRIKANVIAHYGEDSREYQKIGGKPRGSGQSGKPRSSTPTEEEPQIQMVVEAKSTKNGAKSKA